jgi:hypothetical protein
LLSYDVSCISEVSPSMRKASFFFSLAMLYVNVVVSHIYDSTRVMVCSSF